MASIEKRGISSYRIVVCTGYDNVGKKLKETKSITLDPNLTDLQKDKELNRLATLFEDEVLKGTYFEPSKYTVSDFITKWLEERGNDFENKTRYRYEGMLKGRINKALGHLKLEQVKPLHLLDFYRNLQENGIREDTKYIADPNLKELIDTQGMELSKLASASDISERTLKGVLSGKPTTIAQKIVKGFNTKFNLNIKLDKMFVPASDPMPLSNKTIQHYHRVLSVMFNDAVRWGMMKENPCLKAHPPKVTRKEMLRLDEDGVEKMLTCLEAESIKCQALITLLLVTGCRRGEIAALQWDNVDLDNNVVHIKQAATYTPDTGIQVKQPKTASSIRKIKLPDSTIQLLKQYKKYWLEEKLKIGDLWQKESKEELGEAWKESGWVFPTWNGYIMHPDTITSTFKNFLKRHQLPAIRLHDVRHTAATHLIHSGLNVRAVAARMGHANPNVTLTVYSHALQSADEKAADVMEALVKKKEQKGNTKQA